MYEWSLVMLCGFGDLRRQWGDAERKNNNNKDSTEI